MHSKINLELIREVRTEKSIPVRQIISALGLKTEAAYYKKESGLIKFSLEEAKILANTFGMTIEDLFFTSQVS